MKLPLPTFFLSELITMTVTVTDPDLNCFESVRTHRIGANPEKLDLATFWGVWTEENLVNSVFFCSFSLEKPAKCSQNPVYLERGDHPNSWKNAPRILGQMKIFHVGSHQFRESLRELLRELWLSYCPSRGMPFREWNFVFREWNFEFRELLREYPETLRELREWPFRSESVFPEIGVVPRPLSLVNQSSASPRGQLNWTGPIANFSNYPERRKLTN